MNTPRARRLINQAIATFKPDLTGLVVLTEAATGYHALTSMIAALAGAKKVLAITRDSRFGRAVDVRDWTMSLARQWGIEDRIEVLFSRKGDGISQADIVTNLGFVRPIDRPLLRRLKPTAVIPLMWETWEFRPEDLDLVECQRLGIAVLGTNEHHPDLRTFEYVGHIALKLLFALGIEIFRSHVVVLGSGEFAEQTIATLHAAGAEVMPLSLQIEGALNLGAARQALQQADTLVVVEHHDRRMLIGPRGIMSADELRAISPGLAVAHICGGVDRAALEAVGLSCCPDKFAPPGYMSVATDYIGPKPLIDLHTAGLKIGEELARARAQGFTAPQAEFTVLRKTPIAQGFADCHDMRKVEE